MTKSYKSLITKMIKESPSGLTYTKILTNFRNEHPEKYRKSFIRLALSKEPFKLCRKKYVLRKKITKKAKKAKATTTPISVSSVGLAVGPHATIFDNSSVGVVPTLTPSTAHAAVPHWQYEHDGWKNYEKAASDVVEAAFVEWQKNPYTDVRAIKSGEWEYMVDFTNMRQRNIQHESHTERNIRRAMVGIVAAQSLSDPLTVIMLDSFHKTISL